MFKRLFKGAAVFFCAAVFMCIQGCAYGDSISDALNNTNIKNNSVVSLTVKEAESSKTVFSRHSDTYLNPASSLKVFTMAAALDTLGDKYCFETVVYIDKDKNLYLKLGADPLLTSDNLNTLARSIKQAYGGRIKNFYIDDTVIDKKYYPDGWAADDLWPNAPKVSPYIVDGNMLKISFFIDEGKNGLKSIKVIQNDDYKFSFVNELKTGDVTNIVSSLNYSENSGIVTLSGTLAEDCTKDYPVLDTAQFFAFRLRRALDSAGVSYNKPFYPKKVPDNAKRIASFRRPAGEVFKFILGTSNNFAAEVVFKAAGAKWAKESEEYLQRAYISKEKDYRAPEVTGTFELGRDMFFDYYKNAGLDKGKINLVDASGVSRYNTLTTHWMTDALIYLDKNSSIENYMITADEGTLTKRMRNLKGNLKAKTGTIFGVSSLTGYITSQKGIKYVFGMIVQNFSERASLIKGLEDDTVYGIYFLE